MARDSAPAQAEIAFFTPPALCRFSAFPHLSLSFPMSLLSSSASPTDTESAALPVPVPSLRRSSLRDSKLRPILWCSGAMGIGLSLAPLVLKPAPAPSLDARAPLATIALDSEDTLVVTPATPPGALLRGRIRLVAGETDALGRAQASGQVARHLVESGTPVERGDAVVEISSGADRRAVPASEFQQNRAERSQIAAADAQNAVAQKISIAQTQLRAAQERVASAQSQVGVARDIVRRLQNGESVAPGEIPVPFRGSESAAPRASRRTRRRRVKSSENNPTQIAARQAEAARQAAQDSAKALETARTMLADAQNAARQADEKAQISAKSVVEVEARFDDKKATGADVEAARSAQKEAQSAVDAADKALIFAKSELGKREKNAASAQDYARSSTAQAAQALKGAHLETDSGDSTDRGGVENAASNPGNAAPAPARVTLDSAIQFAGAALDESRRASRNAERIHAEIESYQSVVTNSQTRVQAATQDLAQAQQKVMDSVPRPRFTTCYAPSSGIVTWISRLAREVSAGTPIFGIARHQRAAARFEDKSGMWRAVKPDAVLTAFVLNVPAAAGDSAGDGTTASASKLGLGHAIQLKMKEIQAPSAEGEAAKLSGVPVLSQGEGALPEGAQVLVSLPHPGQKATLSVPASALVQRGKITYVALLEPQSASEIQAQNRAAKPESATNSALSSTPRPSQTGTGEASSGETFRLRWVPVSTGRSDGLRLEITSGLQAGARVVSAPEDLEAMGFSPAPFAPAPQVRPTILDTQSGALAEVQASGAALEPDLSGASVLVRLTSSLG